MARSRSVKAGDAFVKFSLRDGQVRKQLKRLQRKFIAVGAGLQRLTAIGLKASAGIAAGFGVAIKTFANVGDNLNKMSARTGFSAQALSELGFAAKQSGTDLAQVEQGIRGMQRTLLDAERGLSTAADNLDDLGVSLDDLQGKTPERQFEILTEAISQVEDPTRRAGLAMRIFGRSGTALLPMLNTGSQGIAALRAEAVALGVTMSDADAQAAAKLTDAMSRLWEQVKQLAVQLGAAVSGPMIKFLEATKPILKATIDWIKASDQLANQAFALIVKGAQKVSEGFASMWEVTKSVWSAMQDAVNSGVSAISFAFNNWSTLIQTASNSAMLSVVRFSNQVVHVMSKVVPGWLSWFADNWRDVFTDAANITATVASNIWTNIKNLWDGIVRLFNGEGFNFELTPLTKGFESAIKELPKIAAREIGPLEKQLQDDLNNLAQDLNKTYKQHREEFARNVEAFSLTNSLEFVLTPTKSQADVAAQASSGIDFAGRELNKTSSRGFFNSAAILAGALEGGSTDLAARTAKATEETALETKRIRKQGGQKVTP